MTSVAPVSIIFLMIEVESAGLRFSWPNVPDSTSIVFTLYEYAYVVSPDVLYLFRRVFTRYGFPSIFAHPIKHLNVGIDTGVRVPPPWYTTSGSPFSSTTLEILSGLTAK